MTALRRRVVACVAAVLIAAAGGAHAQDPDETAANRIKAAFLYHFGGFVEWPADAFDPADAPFTIGVMGADEIGVFLRDLTLRRTIQGREIRVRRIRPGDPLDGVHMLYVGRAAAPELPRAALRIAGRPILLVTETPGAIQRGSVIDFVVEGDRVRFDVDLAAAASRRLRVSARMLEVARLVVREP